MIVLLWLFALGSAAKAIGSPQNKQLLPVATIQYIKGFMPILSIADCIGSKQGLDGGPGTAPSTNGPGQAGSSNPPWTCSECSKYPSMQLVNIWNGRKLYDATAFLAVDNSSKRIYLSFRGTNDIQDVLADLSVSLVKAPEFGDDVRIHRGFYNAYRDSYKQISSGLLATVRAHPNYMVVVAGHSLGGALAAIYALKLITSRALQPSNMLVVTAGQPTVGNKGFAQVSTDKITNMYRLTRKEDIIPRIPFWLGYTQMGHEIYLDDYASNQVYTCSGIENPACSWGDPFRFVPGAHLDYFEKLGCS